MAKIRSKGVPKLEQINRRLHFRYYQRKYITPIIYILFIIETGYLCHLLLTN